MSQQTYYIYLLTCEENGKHYVGQTIKTLDWRFKGHLAKTRAGCSLPIHNAIRHYGEAKFTIRELHRATVWHESQTRLRQHKLDEAERYYVAVYDAMNLEFGYNLTEGGRSNNNPSQQTRDKMRQIKLGVKLTPAQRAKCSWTPSPETRQLWSDQRKGKPAPNKGKPHSQDHKNALKQARGKRKEREAKDGTGFKHSPESLEKIWTNRRLLAEVETWEQAEQMIPLISHPARLRLEKRFNKRG